MISIVTAEYARQLQGYMPDTFPNVLPAGESAIVVYFIEDAGQVQADIKFADEDGRPR